jgi:hypothetical protein
MSRAAVGKNPVCQLCQLPSAASEEKVGCNGHGHHESQSQGITSLRIVDLFRDGRKLLVSRIQPESQSQSDAEHVKGRLVWRDRRNKRIVMPLGQSDHDQHQHRKQNEEFECGGEFPYHLNAAHIDVGDHRDHGEGDDVVPPSRELWKIEAQVVGELHRIDAAQQEGRAPVPPSGEEAPEISKAGAHPAIETALNRHSGGQLGRYQRNRDAPEERDHQQEDQCHSWTGSGDHVFEPEGATGAVGEHYPDEVEEAGFAQGGLRSRGHGLGLYEGIWDSRLRPEGKMPSGQPAGRRRYK